MESKDVVTAILSIAAIIISVLAWRTARQGFKLAQAQDQRALDREKPLIEVDVPWYPGRGPLQVSYKITNRGSEPIQIIGFRMPINLGRTAITTRAPFRFADSVKVDRVKSKPEGNEAGDYDLAVVKADLDPQGACAGRLIIVPESRDRIRSGTDLQLYLDVIVRNREATTYSLPIRRKV